MHFSGYQVRPGKYKQIVLLCAALVLVVLCKPALAQQDRLRSEIMRIAEGVNGVVGVSVLDLSTKDTLTINGNRKFPMQSVYKFPIGLAVLHHVGEGKLSLDQKIELKREDYYPGTWSPLARKYPEGGVEVTLREVLDLTVSASDNNGCDILLRLLGGAPVVNRYVHGLGVADISIVSTEREMHDSPDLQYKNWSMPTAMTRLLEMYYLEDLLSKDHKAILWDAMAGSPTGRNRIKGMLPESVVVAHKPGTSGRDSNNVAGAINDVGIVVLPGGGAVAIAVFISDTSDTHEKLESVIATIAKAVFDHYMGKK